MTNLLEFVVLVENMLFAMEQEHWAGLMRDPDVQKKLSENHIDAEIEVRAAIKQIREGT